MHARDGSAGVLGLNQNTPELGTRKYILYLVWTDQVSKDFLQWESGGKSKSHCRRKVREKKVKTSGSEVGNILGMCIRSHIKRQLKGGKGKEDAGR